MVIKRQLLRPYLGLAFFLLSFLSCQTSDNSDTTQELQFNDYPNLKLGFTTQNFLKVMPVTLESTKQLIDYASDQGFSWVELRDPDAALTPEVCQEIDSYAGEKNIEVSYAIQKGILDEDFWSVFGKGVKNAAVFTGPKIFRSLAAGQEFANDENKRGWTQEELEKLVQYADSAAAIAQENGLQYVIENSTESFFGKDNLYYGIVDVLASTGDQVGFQFDTANPFSVAKEHPVPDSVLSYLKDNADILYYIHLKAARNGEAQPVLMENPLDFTSMFQVMSEHDIPYVAIELSAVEDEEQAFENMRKSIHYLEEQGVITSNGQ